MLSKILSRLAIKGGVVASAGSGDATKLPILASDGKLDPTTYVSGGGGSGAASTTTFNPVYTSSTLDHGSTGEGGPSPQDVQAALQEIDLQKLQYDRNLSDVASPSTSFNNIKLAATTALAGVVELATLAEANAGTANGSDTIATGGTSRLIPPNDILKQIYINKYDPAGDTMSGPLILPNVSPIGDSEAARKKYVDDQITARITANSTIPTGKILWVDGVNGKLLADTAPPVRGRLDRPFIKLAEAKATAVAGDTIFVMPTIYDERNLLKDGVNWYFMPGAKITTTANVNGGIWDDGGSYGTNAAVVCKITGYGEFSNGATTGTASVFNITNSSSNVYVECVSMTNASSSVSTLVLTNGISSFTVLDSITSNAGSLMDVNGGTHVVKVDKLVGVNGIFMAGGATFDLRFRTFSTTLYAFFQSTTSGTYILVGDTITGGTSLGQTITLDGSSGSTFIDVRKITAGTDVVVLATASTAPIKIADTELVNTKANSAAAAIKAFTATVITLKDVDMTMNAAATNCIIPQSANTPTVILHGYIRSNKPKHASITFNHGVFEQV